ncbi:hypothetical protein Tsubulata_002842 [Turnera subulata]|uniref:Deoxyhypusine hydroxylase n=1 Tax=Turnera subulata TaxID=218843 RepID=A0A9Q0F033_9ROSI|nr:hypothetical protein Tsubulata_002842 [Turnera subulata]
MHNKWPKNNKNRSPRSSPNRSQMTSQRPENKPIYKKWSLLNHAVISFSYSAKKRQGKAKQEEPDSDWKLGASLDIKKPTTPYFPSSSPVMGSLNNGVSEMEKFLCDRLVDQTQPIEERFRALFSLRNLKGPAPRNALIQATRDPSNLLAHEAAFALGQMQDAEAIPALEAVLNDLSLHPIVRHEAAEALGAIGLEGNAPLLKSSLSADPAQEVRETCELALKRIEETNKENSEADSSTKEKSPFLSVDPAAPASSFSSVTELREVLLDEEKGMYERYAALFALRNHGGDEAVSAIIDSLGANSALLKHEVAYVLGQLQNKAASAALCRILRDANEHPMVRHEAAEALGSIADNHSVALLEEFAKDAEPLVAQSCQVALSMLEFERSGKSFEYLFMQDPLAQA